MSASEILVIILSVFLALFLLLAIVLTILLIKVTKQIKSVTTTAQTAAEKLGVAAATVSKVTSPALLAKMALETIKKMKKIVCMDAIRNHINRFLEKLKSKQAKSAQKTLLEELFNDLYANRAQLYKVNFFRGIFFGLGSVLGGTIVLALVVWLLSLFVNFPVIGNFFEETEQTLQDTSSPQ